MDSLTIGGKDLYTEFGFILASKSIGAPSLQTHIIDVPLRNGAIDATESLTGFPRYDNRELEISMIYVGDKSQFYAKYSELANYLHGKRLKIIFDDDCSFYYIGRITVDSSGTKNHSITIKLKVDCEPFKYDVSPADEDWLWDTFDFENGVINETAEIIVDGSSTYTLITRIGGESPKIEASDEMTMTFNGSTYSLIQGNQKIYDFFLNQGENVLTFTGSGTVTIHYNGGSI